MKRIANIFSAILLITFFASCGKEKYKHCHSCGGGGGIDTTTTTVTHLDTIHWEPGDIAGRWTGYIYSANSLNGSVYAFDEDSLGNTSYSVWPTSGNRVTSPTIYAVTLHASWDENDISESDIALFSNSSAVYDKIKDHFTNDPNAAPVKVQFTRRASGNKYGEIFSPKTNIDLYIVDIVI